MAFSARIVRIGMKNEYEKAEPHRSTVHIPDKTTSCLQCYKYFKMAR
jgi:hypothetical protein